MTWASGAHGRSPSPPPPSSLSPPPPPLPPAFFDGVGETAERLYVARPKKAKDELLVSVVLLDGRRLEAVCDARTSVHQLLQAVCGRASLEGRPVALAAPLWGELVFPPPRGLLARLLRLATAPAPSAPAAPAAAAPAPRRPLRAPPQLRLTLLLRILLVVPALPALSDVCGRHLLFLELRRRAAEGRARGSRAQLKVLDALARRADAAAPAAPAASAADAQVPRPEASETPMRRRHSSAAAAGAAAEAQRRAEDAFVAAAVRLPLAGAHLLSALWAQGLSGSRTQPLAVSVAVAPDALSVLASASASPAPAPGPAPAPAPAPAPRELLRLPWPAVRALAHSERSCRVSARADALDRRPRNYKFYLPHKKSIFLFHLASIHHQTYLNLQNHLSSILPTLVSGALDSIQETRENRDNACRRLQQYEEDSCKENNMFYKINPKSGLSENIQRNETNKNLRSPHPPEAFVLKSSVISNENFLLFQESLNQSLIEKFEEISSEDVRVLSSVRIERDVGGSLGLQVECGNDGGIYVRCSLQSNSNIQRGDRIVAVDGKNLMHLKYTEALDLLKSASHNVELIVSRQSSHSNKHPCTSSSHLLVCEQEKHISPCRKFSRCK